METEAANQVGAEAHGKSASSRRRIATDPARELRQPLWLPRRKVSCRVLGLAIILIRKTVPLSDRIRRFLASDACLRVSAPVLITVCRVALGVFSFQRLQRIVLTLAPSAGGRAGGDSRSLDEVGPVVARAGRLVRGNCLPQALAGYMLLAWRGQSPQLRVGVSKGRSGRLVAHAWLECAGRVVVGEDGDLSQYTQLMVLDEGSRLNVSRHQDP